MALSYRWLRADLKNPIPIAVVPPMEKNRQLKDWELMII